MKAERKLVFTCPHCGSRQFFDAVKEVDLHEDPEFRDRIMSGMVFMRRCASCGRDARLLHELRVTDSAKHYLVQLAPKEHFDQLTAEFRQLAVSEAGHEVFRMTDFLNSFKEKINIFEAGRDDRLIEIAKQLLTAYAAKNYPQLEIDYIHYLNDPVHGGEVWILLTKQGIMKAGFDMKMYHDARHILEHAGADEPYIIDSSWASEVCAKYRLKQYA
ncbi:MAG: CpXC domain-containing protein [Solobacterium sp.]|nr:CpXC domain-containing protein [Solobacterium sp.]